MNIFGLTTRQTGCGFHRVILPMNYMKGIKGIISDSEQNEKFDLLLFNRLTKYYDSNLQSARDKYNCKTIMDIDDDWILPTKHILNFSLSEVQHHIEDNLRNADCVTTTRELIAEKIYPFNNRVELLPNAIPYGRDQFNTDKVMDERIRFFWCGSVTHEHDLAILRYPIQRLQGYKKKIKMVLGGYFVSDPLTTMTWNRMAKYFTNYGQLDFEIYPGVLPEQYIDLYQFADVCLIPLENSSWHACKSNLKILESAVKKCPVIVSNVKPYADDTDAPVKWVNNTSDWHKHITYYINNPTAIKDDGEALHEWAKEKYNFEKINARRKELFESVARS